MATIFLYRDDLTGITCRHTDGERGYPVLTLGSTTIFPSIEQMRRMHQAIGSYLAERDIGVGRELRPTVRCPRCEGRPKIYRDGLIDAICPVCAGAGSVSPWRPTMAVRGHEPRASRAVVPAEACTGCTDCGDVRHDRLDPVDGAVVDGDELLVSIAETWADPELDAALADEFPARLPYHDAIETTYHGYRDGIDLADAGRRNCPGEVS